MDTFKIRKVEVSGERFIGTNQNDITLSVPSDNNGKSIHIGLSNSSNYVSIKPDYTVINNNLQVVGDIVTKNNALIAELPITTSDIANGAINADKLMSKTGLSDTVVLSQNPMLYTPSIRGEMIFSPLALNESNVEILTQVDAKNVLPGKYADGSYEYTNLNIADGLLFTRKTPGKLFEAPVDGLVNDRYGISYDSTGSMTIYSSKKNSSSKINIGFASGSMTYDSPLVINQQYITTNTMQTNDNSFYCLRVQNGGILIDTNNAKGDMDYLDRSYEMKNRNSFQIRNNDLVANTGSYNPLSEYVHKVRMKIGKSSDDYASIVYTMGDGESNSHAVFSLNSEDALVLSKGKSYVTSSKFEVNDLIVKGSLTQLINNNNSNLYLNISSNLSDVQNISLARENLGLGETGTVTFERLYITRDIQCEKDLVSYTRFLGYDICRVFDQGLAISRSYNNLSYTACPLDVYGTTRVDNLYAKKDLYTPLIETNNIKQYNKVDITLVHETGPDAFNYSVNQNIINVDLVSYITFDRDGIWGVKLFPGQGYYQNKYPVIRIDLPYKNSIENIELISGNVHFIDVRGRSSDTTIYYTSSTFFYGKFENGVFTKTSSVDYAEYYLAIVSIQSDTYTVPSCTLKITMNETPYSPILQIGDSNSNSKVSITNDLVASNIEVNNVTIKGSLATSNNINVAGAASLSNTTVTGLATFSNNINALGTTTLSNTNITDAFVLDNANSMITMKSSYYGTDPTNSYQYNVRPFLQYEPGNKPLIQITEGRNTECNDITMNMHIYDDAEWSLFHNGNYLLTANSDWRTHKKTFSVFCDYVELKSVVGITKSLELGNSLAGNDDTVNTGLLIHHQYSQAPTMSSTANDYALIVSRMGGMASLGFSAQKNNNSDTTRVPGASIMFEADNYETGSAGKLMFNISSNVSSFTDSQINVMTIDKSTNVGIGIIQPSEKLHVNGNILTNNISIGSDDRIKTNEVFITNATETINKLRPQVYDKWNTINYSLDSNAQYVKESGLIAQEIFYDAPELRHLIRLPIDSDSNMIYDVASNIQSSVDPSIDPIYSGWGSNTAAINYIGLIPYLIKALQEKDVELIDTKNKLTIAESNITSLDARLTAAGY